MGRKPIGLVFFNQPDHFVPTDLAGCVLWLRADLGISIGTGVSAWADQSGQGNNYSQGTGANQPGIAANGNARGNGPALTFSGATQYLFRASSPLGNNTLSCFVVFKATAASIALSMGVNAGHTSGWAVDRNANAGNREVIAPSIADITDGVVTNNWEFWSITRGAAASAWALSVNGVSQSLLSNTSDPAAQTAASAIGAFDTSGGVPMTGSLDEIICYSRPVTAFEQAQVEAYLHARTGL